MQLLRHLVPMTAVALLLAGYTLAQHAPPPSRPPAPKKELLVEAPPPPFSEGIFPCSSCHDKASNPTRRKLDYHDELQEQFDHDKEHRWCLDCHDNAKRDLLHLSNGETLPFTESYRLCGQCHGDKYRDWRRGIHGRRVGQWNGQKTYLLCVHCHNPHAPRFKPMKPEPRPQRPSEMKR